MKILLVHNYYKQKGGEDVVFETEVQLLRQAGLDVESYSVSNNIIEGSMSTVKSAFMLNGIAGYIPSIVKRVRILRPDIVHFHNVFPLISTAAFHAVRAEQCAVVHTIHNFRPICAAGTFFRDGAVCDLCLHGATYQAIVHKCYRGSRIGSAALAGAIARDRRRNIWSRDLDTIFALTDFAKSKLIEAGLPADRLVVKSNSVADPGPLQGQTRNGLLFVGRLSPEKGLRVLLEAANHIDQQVTICGDGPEGDQLRLIAGPNVHFTGAQPYGAVQQLMRCARALVIPSLWYEGFPMTAVEALAHGTPLICSDVGSLAEIIHKSKAGHLFEPGNAAHLAQTLRVALDLPQSTASAAARLAYTTQFSEGINVSHLKKAYLNAIDRRQSVPPRQ